MAEHLFKAFQASLSLHTKMGRVKELVPTALAKEEVDLSRERATTKRCEGLSARLEDALNELEAEGHAKEELKSCLKSTLNRTLAAEVEIVTTKKTLVVNEKEAGVLRSKLKEAEDEMSDLKDRLKAIEYGTRVKVNAAITHRHLEGKDPMKSAAKVLNFLYEVVRGTPTDLDLEDEEDVGSPSTEVFDEPPIDQPAP